MGLQHQHFTEADRSNVVWSDDSNLLLLVLILDTHKYIHSKFYPIKRGVQRNCATDACCTCASKAFCYHLQCYTYSMHLSLRWARALLVQNGFFRVSTNSAFGYFSQGNSSCAYKTSLISGAEWNLSLRDWVRETDNEDSFLYHLWKIRHNDLV